MNASPDILIVGAGPAGLAAALELAKDPGLDILVIDRDEEAGGLPHYCGHPGFGWEYSGRFHHSGHRFCAFMLGKIAAFSNIRLLTRTTLLNLSEGPEAVLLNPELGRVLSRPQGILLATGVREAPRAPRMLGGNRPPYAFVNTGFLQQWLSRALGPGLPGQAAGEEAIILGTEWVSFSAWLSARQLGLSVTAFVETESRVQAPDVFGWGMRTVFGVPVYTGAKVESVEGGVHGLTGLRIREKSGLSRFLPGRRIIMTGGWQGDSAAAEASGLAINLATRCLAVDEYFRCGPDGVWATGNVIQPLLDSGRAALLGRAAGAAISRCLTAAPPPSSLSLTAGEGILSLSPARLTCGEKLPEAGLTRLHLRPRHDMNEGNLQLRTHSGVIWKRRLGRLKAADNIFIPLNELRPSLTGTAEVEFFMTE